MARGWNEDEPSSGGKYLKLKSKGDQATVRIIADPYHFWTEYTNPQTGVTKKNQRFAMPVVHINDPNGPSAKIFQCGLAIYLKLKELVASEDWGDPKHYDVKIKRTELSPINFYSVIPGQKRSLNPDEKKAAGDAHKFDIEGEVAAFECAPPSQQGHDAGDADDLPPVGKPPALKAPSEAQDDELDPFADEAD